MHHTFKKYVCAVLAFIKTIRQRYPPGQRIYLVLDNPSTHTTPEILEWCRHNNITLVFTATKASWMNRIECHFTAAHYFVIKNSDPPNHKHVARRMQEYLRWRRKNVKNEKLPKVQNSRKTL